MKGAAAAALGLGLVTALACDGGKKASTDPAAGGCTKDTDCKGERVCVKGVCSADTAGKGTATAAAKPAATVVPSATPPTSNFLAVDSAEWTPRLGPKMRPGSKVVHQVFAGPFAPSPQSLFSLQQRRDDTFWVVVMGDDNKSWPAGPLAEPKTYRADKIMAVSFFDADGDGKTNALVIARYIGPTKTEYFNVLLKWTDQGLRRLLKIEPTIAKLESVQAVRQKLGK